MILEENNKTKQNTFLLQLNCSNPGHSRQAGDVTSPLLMARLVAEGQTVVLSICMSSEAFTPVSLPSSEHLYVACAGSESLLLCFSTVGETAHYQSLALGLGTG